LPTGAELYRGLVDNINLGITLIAPDFRVVTTNAAQTRICDRPIEEIVGHQCFQVFRKQTSACPDCPGRRAMDSGRPAEIEHSGFRRDGSSLMVRVQAFPLFQPDGSSAGFIEVVEDITEHRVLQQQLQQSQKMEAIGQLAGGIAHDFRNQLTVIRGYGQMLCESLPAGKGREMLDEILHAADRSVEITGQLLAFSRRDTLHPQTHDLNELVADLAKALGRILNEDITLATAADPTPCPATVDAIQFQHALMNLAANARDAMPAGGQLTIRTRLTRTDAAFAEQHPEVTPGRFVVVEVADIGSGMDEATKARIFEPFFTTKQVGQGTGLGLAMVYGFVRQSGGAIEVDSEPGKGTTVRLFFPAATAAGLTPQADSAPAKVPHRGDETILVVEDEPAVRKLLLASLRQGGYHILESANGLDALRLAERHPGPIDLLLTDVILPGADGVDLSHRLRQRRPKVRVLYVSGYAGKHLAQHGVDGASRLLAKPFSTHELLATVRQALDAANPRTNTCAAAS
jgi:PAS domain S-box-containing protein